jgi:N,N'-diacetyllegionaminate synthase
MTFPPVFDVQGREIGGDAPAYVIAEIGANHDRDLDKARALIDAAAAAGADAVKFQTYSGDRIYSRKTPPFRYLEPVSGTRSPAALLEEISLPRDWQALLADHARARSVHFFSSPFDHDAVAELEQIGVPALKIASFEIVDLGLIRRAAQAGVPLFISTGMSTIGEIEDAVAAAMEGGAPAVGLMQCASTYPAPASDVNLRAMATLATVFGVPTGFSDHTLGTAVPIAAAALGASFVEKHFTLDRTSVGPDHAFALEPDDFEAMVRGIRDAQTALGDGRKTGPTEAEREEMYRLGRRSLIAAADLPAGTVLTSEMIVVKRPGYGIPPKFIDLVVGRTLRSDVEEDDVLTWEMV